MNEEKKKAGSHITRDMEIVTGFHGGHGFKVIVFGAEVYELEQFVPLKSRSVLVYAMRNLL